MIAQQKTNLYIDQFNSFCIEFYRNDINLDQLKNLTKQLVAQEQNPHQLLVDFCESGINNEENDCSLGMLDKVTKELNLPNYKIIPKYQLVNELLRVKLRLFLSENLSLDKLEHFIYANFDISELLTPRNINNHTARNYSEGGFLANLKELVVNIHCFEQQQEFFQKLSYHKERNINCKIHNLVEIKLNRSARKLLNSV